MKQVHKINPKEKFAAEQISRIVPELRLVEAKYFIENIVKERIANIEDIVNAATELHFLPNSISFANECSYLLDWDILPIIKFKMYFNHNGVKFYFYLSLAKDSFGIHIPKVNYDMPNMADNLKLEYFQNALISARLDKAYQEQIKRLK